MERLHPCPICARHLRSSERACPFCGASLASATPSLPSAGGRLGRAALFAFRATAVAALGTLPACGDDQNEPPPPITTPPEETIAQPYGAPPEPPPPVPQPPVPPPPVVPDTSIAQPLLPQDSPVEPDPTPPPTHDHEHHRRPPRTVAVPAYGISPHYGPGGPDDIE